MDIRHQSLWNNINLWVFSTASFLSDVSIQSTLAILPAYFVSITNPTIAPLYTSVTISGYLALSYICTFLFGWMSSITGIRKPLIAGGYAIEGCLIAAVAFFTTPWMAACMRIASGVGKGMRRASRAATLSASVAQENYGKAFGIHQGIDKAGGIFGLICVFFMLDTHSYQALFIYALIPMLIATWCIMQWMYDPFDTQIDIETAKLSQFTLLYRCPKIFWYFIGILSIFSLCQIPAATVLLRNYGDSGIMIHLFQDYYAVGLYITYAIARTISGYIAGTMTNYTYPLYILAIGFASFICASLSMILDIQIAAIGFPLFFFFGVSNIVITTMELSILPYMLPRYLRDAGYGILYVARGTGMLCAGWIIGWIWSSYTAWHAFWYICTLSTTSIIALILYSSQYHIGTHTNTGKRE